MQAMRPAARLLGRALLRRCPNCGAPGIFRSWLRMLPECPDCGLPLERKEAGYVVGAYMFNIIAAELVFGLLFVATLVVYWPDPPWRFLLISGVLVMVIMPVAFYPISKTLFLAFDLIFRPAGYEPVERTRAMPDPRSSR